MPKDLPKREISWMLNWYANFENLNQTITNAMLMKLTTIMYGHEKVNQKALEAGNSVF